MSSPLRIARIAIRGLQSTLSRALGVSRQKRIETVLEMLDNNARLAPGYWLQLLLATAIATLGLALDSTAVVIGGMLVSPLMGPIVELGMGFAVGSSLLVIRAFLRVLMSVITVIATAALMTIALPFHELTSEIASRTSPTLLDLLVAVFCALAAAYTTVRQTSETTAAAAGTAIGIALVPPLCVTGFGIGTQSAEIAGGAALLVTANFSAILVVAVLSFLLLGFDQVDAEQLELTYGDPSRSRADAWAGRLEHALREGFGSRFGLPVRLFVPVLFLGIVAIPLSRALDEVAWEVRARDTVRRSLSAEGVRAVQTAVAVEHHTISLRLVVIGTPQSAAQLERRLSARIENSVGEKPTVVVTPVPDATTLERTLSTPRTNAGGGPSTTDIAMTTERIGAILNSVWPVQAAGVLVGWSFQIGPKNAPTLYVRHMGSPLGGAGEQMLAHELLSAVTASTQIVDIPLPSVALAAKSARDTTWLVDAVTVLANVHAGDNVFVCATRPARSTPPLTNEMVQRRLESTTAGRAGMISLSPGVAWSILLSQKQCATLSDSSTADRTR